MICIVVADNEVLTRNGIRVILHQAPDIHLAAEPLVGARRRCW
ncbi:hypothetical protein FB157_120185 [Streptomyces sp. BK340]|nr:hypothetical protein FB157_120185 [Streptomyces sp. BK340]